MSRVLAWLKGLGGVFVTLGVLAWGLLKLREARNRRDAAVKADTEAQFWEQARVYDEQAERKAAVAAAAKDRHATAAEHIRQQGLQRLEKLREARPSAKAEQLIADYERLL